MHPFIRQVSELLDKMTGRKQDEFPPFDGCVRWIEQYPTGHLSCLMYTDEEVAEKKVTDKAIGKERYGRFIKVRITEEGDANVPAE